MYVTPRTSDHRPVVARFNAAGGHVSGRPTREELLRRIEQMERELRRLREALRRTP